ncbi:hypothetical protein PUN28_008925 [Cardiocondyla obscurior]
MWLDKISMCRFLFLFVAGLALSRTLQASEETREAKVIVEKSPSISDRSSSSLKPVAESNPGNDTDDFKPSRHLGEIEESVARTSPFNNVQHVKFENNVHLDAQQERFQNILQDASQGISSLLDEVTRSSRIKFQDDRATQASARYPFDVADTSESQFENGAVSHVLVDQALLQNAEVPESPEAQNVFGKTTTGVYYDATRSPYVVHYYTDQSQNAYHHPTSQETAVEVAARPDSSGVVMVQQHESTYTRKRKFPYSFYQPGNEYHDVQYGEDPQPTVAYPRVRRPFPWKKIIHLIGTFLPLGLLLAALKPNVIRIDNTTTQPNIVLSKFRLADLPLEHKRGRALDDQPIGCEDRSVCELILAGGEPRSSILQNVLWNLATR